MSDNRIQMGPRAYVACLDGVGTRDEIAADLAVLRAAPKMHEALRTAVSVASDCTALVAEALVVLRRALPADSTARDELERLQEVRMMLLGVANDRAALAMVEGK